MSSSKLHTIIDDPSVSTETRVYYSKKKLIFENILLCGGILLGIYFFIFKEGFQNKGLGILICAVAGVFLNVNYSKLNNTKVQLLLTNKGMQTPDADFCNWEQISEETVTEESFKGTTNYYLNYNYKNCSERMLITNLDFDPKEIERLIGIYRKRSEI